MQDHPPPQPQPQPTPVSPTAGLAERFRRSPVVWTLIAANVAVLLLTEALGGSGDIRTMLDLGAMPKPLPVGEAWRVVTSMFLHFGFIHLAFNMWALYVFGPLFERLLGGGRFLALYAAAGLAGGAASALFAPVGSVSAGASGAIFGLLGAFLILGVQLRHTPQGRSFVQQALFLLAINLALGLGDRSIGLAAHIGGFVGGAVVYGAHWLATHRARVSLPLVRTGGPTLYVAAVAVGGTAVAIVLSTTVRGLTLG